MFQKRKRLPFLRFEATSRNQLLKRVATLSAGIFFLWIALQIMPKPVRDLPPAELTEETAAPLISPEASAHRSDTMGFLKNTQIGAGILLLVLLGFMYYKYKKSRPERPSIKPLNTLHRVQLSPHQHLYLIECGHEALLIGATNTEITLLKNMPLAALTRDTLQEPAKPISYPFTQPVSTQEESGDFATLLHSYSSANIN